MKRKKKRKKKMENNGKKKRKKKKQTVAKAFPSAPLVSLKWNFMLVR